MTTDQGESRVAQPADEELKKHGDQLKKQVNDVAARQSPEKEDEKGRDALGD